MHRILRLGTCLGICLWGSVLSADGGITFETLDGAHNDYVRGFSDSYAVIEAAKETPIPLNQLLATPHVPTGNPGVALLDFDLDGDLDIYATNGPGVANSLYSNQLRETGEIGFVDVGEASGAGAADQDSTGVCYGDIDNDLDPDLLVVSNQDGNRLFINQGDGTFIDHSNASGIAGTSYGAIGCSMGDVNQDGLLDIYIGNTWDWDAIFVAVDPFTENQHDQLFLNLGDATFADISETSGIQTLVGLPPGVANVSWAVAMVDYDQDGDVDIVIGTDQPAGVPAAEEGGIDIGYIRLLINDGSGHFFDGTYQAGTDLWGNWMGTAFGDLNCDGWMDMFLTNNGDFATLAQSGRPVGTLTTRWLFGQPNGTFSDPGVGDLIATPFGWGEAMVDYDNDGDQDLVFHGSVYTTFGLCLSQSALVLRNDGLCSGLFSYADEAIEPTPDVFRQGFGLAMGDLDEDGFLDLVTVASARIPRTDPVQDLPTFGGPLDGFSKTIRSFIDVPEGRLFNPELNMLPGDLQVDLNSGDNGNGSIAVDVVGSVNITANGTVNRDGVGAIVYFQPEDGQPVMKPVMGGSSFASQHSQIIHFGLGTARRGDLTVQWPGGVRNRLYNVRADSRLTLPEIPCSFDDPDLSLPQYVRCVVRSVLSLRRAGIVDARDVGALIGSAVRAYRETH